MSQPPRLRLLLRYLTTAAVVLCAAGEAGCVASYDTGAVAVVRGAPALMTATDGVGEDAWDSYGGVSIGCPAIAVSPQGDIDVFTHGEDNALWTRHRDHLDGAWREWQSLGGVLTSAPAVAAGKDGRLDVFVRGANNGLWVRTLDRSWGEWQSLGGILNSAPAAVNAGHGRIAVVVRGTDGAAWMRESHQGQWGGWTSIGGKITSAPAVTSWGGVRLDVFARGTDNALWHRSRDITAEGGPDEDVAPEWTEWQSRGGVVWSDPAAISVRPGRIDVAVRGTDNALWVQRFDGAWGGWKSGGGKLYSAVSIAAAGSDRLLFLGAASDNVLETLHGPGAATGGRRIEGARLLPPPS